MSTDIPSQTTERMRRLLANYAEDLLRLRAKYWPHINALTREELATLPETLVHNDFHRIKADCTMSAALDDDARAYHAKH